MVAPFVEVLIQFLVPVLARRPRPCDRSVARKIRSVCVKGRRFPEWEAPRGLNSDAAMPERWRGLGFPCENTRGVTKKQRE